MQLTLIRHLPTEWNQKTWLQGRRDIDILPVTEAIRIEIEQNLQTIQRLAPFDLVLASALKRTQQTAAQYGYTPETERLLDELDFGPFEGQPKELMIQQYKELWFEQPKEILLGESVAQLEERIEAFIAKYQTMSSLLVFGHGSWIRAMISYNQYGHINNMNKVTVGNNHCLTLMV